MTDYAMFEVGKVYVDAYDDNTVITIKKRFPGCLGRTHCRNYRKRKIRMELELLTCIRKGVIKMNYADKEKWAVDLEILSFNYRVALENYAGKIRSALTAAGNSGVVSYDEDNEDYCRLSIFGDAHGDNARLKNIFKELWELGCSFEYPESVTAEDWQAMHELCGVC